MAEIIIKKKPKVKNSGKEILSTESNQEMATMEQLLKLQKYINDNYCNKSKF